MLFLKTSLFAGCFWLTATLASAQFTAGSRFIGGGFGLSTPVAPKFAPNINVSLQPEFGHFKSPNTAVGFTTILGISSAESSTLKSNSYELGVGPFIQQFLPVSSNFGFVLTGRSALGVSFGKEQAIGNSGIITSEKTTMNMSLGLSASPGLFYQLNERWLLLFDVGYYPALNVSYASDKTTQDTSERKNSQVNFGIGRTFSMAGSAIRIRYFLY